MYDAFFKKLDCRSKAAALFYKVTGSNGWICIMECKVLFILQVNCAALSAAVPVGFFFFSSFTTYNVLHVFSRFCWTDNSNALMFARFFWSTCLGDTRCFFDNYLTA